MKFNYAVDSACRFYKILDFILYYIKIGLSLLPELLKAYIYMFISPFRCIEIRLILLYKVSSFIYGYDNEYCGCKTYFCKKLPTYWTFWEVDLNYQSFLSFYKYFIPSKNSLESIVSWDSWSTFSDWLRKEWAFFIVCVCFEYFIVSPSTATHFMVLTFFIFFSNWVFPSSFECFLLSS